MSCTYPSALQSRYYSVQAKSATGMIVGPVRIYKYRNNSHSDPDTSAAAGLKMKDKIIGALRYRYQQITGTEQKGSLIDVPAEKRKDWFPSLQGLVIDKTAIVRAFVGKGSIEDIQLSLSCALATEKVEASREALQKMCDDCIGLDCNGFVGNFTKQKGMMKADGNYGPNTDPSTFAANGIKRHSVEEICEQDVLLWPGSPQHIAIVNWRPSITRWMQITESTASLGGLDSRWYEFTGKTSYGDTMVKGGGKGTMFEVRRPTKWGTYAKKWVLVCKIG